MHLNQAYEWYGREYYSGLALGHCLPFFQHEDRIQDRFQMSSLTIDDDWCGRAGQPMDRNPSGR
jgi:hypothetical protein